MKQVLKKLCSIFLILCVNCWDLDAKTTDSAFDLDYDFEMMQPTPLARRFKVQSNSPPRSLFQVTAKKDERTLDVWKWDHRCQRQPVIGRCKEALPRYFYEVSRKECVRFTYSGCDGNSNNFKSLYDCETNCKGTFSSVSNTTDNSFCVLQPNAGSCFDLLERYYYNVNRRTCVKFFYGGCGGNDNNFEKQSECNKACGDVVVEDTKETYKGENEWSSDSS